MKCPRCRSERVVTHERPYITAHFGCLDCLARWRIIRGRVQMIRMGAYERGS